MQKRTRTKSQVQVKDLGLLDQGLEFRDFGRRHILRHDWCVPKGEQKQPLAREAGARRHFRQASIHSK